MVVATELQANIDFYAGNLEDRGGYWVVAANEFKAQAATATTYDEVYTAYLLVFNRYQGRVTAPEPLPTIPGVTPVLPGEPAAKWPWGWLLVVLGAVFVLPKVFKKKKR